MKPWWRRLAAQARPYRKGLAAIAALVVVNAAAGLLLPWPLKLLVDYVLANKPLPRGAAWLAGLPGGQSPDGLIAWLSVATVILFLVSQGAQLGQKYIEAGIGNRMKYNLGAKLLDHMQRLSLTFHARQPVGDLVRRIMTDTGSVRDLVLGVFVPILGSAVTLASMFVVMWWLSPTLTLVALAIAPLIVVLIRLFDSPMMERSYRYQELEGQIMALAEQTLSALPVVQAFGRESHEDRRFRRLTERTLDAYLRSILAQLQFKLGVGSATAVGLAAIMLLGGLRVLDGSLSTGSLLVFLSYTATLYSPLESAAYLSLSFTTAAAGARRVLTVLDAPEAVRESRSAGGLPPAAGNRGRVQLVGVTFGYEPGQPVLQDVNLEVHPGETIALVGATGAGKSTLVSLIPRFFDPWEGSVLFDGVDVRDLRLSELRPQVSFLFQEPFLFPMSVADNISYGRPGASRDEIEAAAVAANADGFIRRLPGGYDAVIAERGGMLSVGERQRLAVARALLKDAPVLILDEPTSALDTGTEVALLRAIEQLMVQRTTFLIAHRLSTVRRAQRIVVLERGRVVEMGTHEELIAAAGVYRQYYELQFGSRIAGKQAG